VKKVGRFRESTLPKSVLLPYNNPAHPQFPPAFNRGLIFFKTGYRALPQNELHLVPPPQFLSFESHCLFQGLGEYRVPCETLVDVLRGPLAGGDPPPLPRPRQKRENVTGGNFGLMGV